MLEIYNLRGMGHRQRLEVLLKDHRLNEERVTFSEYMVDGLGQIDYSIIGVISELFEKFEVKVVMRVIDDEFFVKSYGRVEFIIEIQVAGFREHQPNSKQS